MSTLRTLDEIPSEELVKELLRRGYDRARGICPYCKKKLIQMGGKTICICRFGDTDKYHPVHALKPLQYGD